MQKSYRIGTLLVLAALIPVVAATAVGNLITGRNQIDICGPHIRAAEVSNGIPRGLLRSIALAESGGYNRVKGANAAWPWTLNNAGRGYYFRSKGAAVQKVLALRRAGKTNIDVGCMQVNLYYHGSHFRSVVDALDPSRNAAYAGKLLRSHFKRTGNWRAAVGRYHSATPVRGKRYASKVYRFWGRNGGGVAVASLNSGRSYSGGASGGLDVPTRSGSGALAAAMSYGANMGDYTPPPAGQYGSQSRIIAAARPRPSIVDGIIPGRPRVPGSTSGMASRGANMRGITGGYSVATSGLAAGGAYTGSMKPTGGITGDTGTGRTMTPNAAFAEFLMTGRGGPKTPRVKAGAKAARQPALQHGKRPGTRIQTLRRLPAKRPVAGAATGARAAGRPPARLPQANTRAGRIANELNNALNGAVNGGLNGTGSQATLGLPPSKHVTGVLTSNTGLMPGLTGSRYKPTAGARGAAFLRGQSSLGARPGGTRPGAFGAAGAKRLKLYRQNGAPAKTYKFTRKKK